MAAAASGFLDVRFRGITALTEALRDVAGGCEGGGSWKESVSETATFEEVLEAARPTILKADTAPGDSISVKLTKAYNALKEAPPADNKNKQREGERERERERERDKQQRERERERDTDRPIRST